MSAQIERYGTTASGEDVARVTIADGLRVEVLTYGGIVARLEAPGRAGPENVVLGLRTLGEYETLSPNFGATIGRYANRIAGAGFTLDGVTHRLLANEGPNTLHGGPAGFGKRVWTVEDATRDGVTLGLVSPDGDEGFPGTLRVRLQITVRGGTLRLDYRAETDAPTVVNLTNHSYFNLAGEGSGDVWGHTLSVAAERMLELGRDGLPTGALLEVAGTPFDFRQGRAVGERVREAHPQIMAGLGYDCCLPLSGTGLRDVATLREPTSLRTMTVRTDQPSLQLYSANRLTGALAGPSGRAYRSGDGLCFETQHYPDSPNHAHFPSTVLRPGDTYETATEYVFSVG